MDSAAVRHAVRPVGNGKETVIDLLERLVDKGVEEGSPLSGRIRGARKGRIARNGFLKRTFLAVQWYEIQYMGTLHGVDEQQGDPPAFSALAQSPPAGSEMSP